MTTWTRDCACGAAVTADPLDPTPGVRYHNVREPHRSYSRRTSWAPPPLEPSPTAASAPVDVSGSTSVRPGRLQRPRVRARRFVPGRRVS